MTQEAAAEAANKRKAEEEPAAGEAEGVPPAKEPKTEPEVKDEPAAEADDAEEAAPAEGAPAEAAADGEQAAAAPQEPVTIGYKTFASGDAALQYYRTLIAKLRKYQNLNDYEFHMVYELVKQGHPDATRKLEGGVRAIQIREVDIGGNVTACFFLVHEDGSDEDVSYRKCLANLFADMKGLTQSAPSGGARKSSGRGSGGRGGGRGGRGSPGRGRGGRGGRGRGCGRR
ncbi:Guanine nucleotide-binding subunit beta 1 [Chlorella sorokiniana]|uniref:Guanine nucleotide-binding subunit beta 1 n=1 Tax=Chlorella sorokiniana TaxID=3076 RepID=A0A2P6TKV9_CHLSO|nr:Guanine nucleotide-binding subunit beta 1 [Chlorella sorokiniana]|eukprot:PRW44914.1 Guanine nucleotide-binding subunit beta 1 [Chlorella sorokiniana]